MNWIIYHEYNCHEITTTDLLGDSVKNTITKSSLRVINSSGEVSNTETTFDTGDLGMDVGLYVLLNSVGDHISIKTMYWRNNIKLLPSSENSEVK